MIKPDNPGKIVWDIIGMIFILYQGILTPFRICFSQNSVGFLAGFEIFQDFYFIIDIFLSLNTGVYIEGNLEMKRQKVVIEYFKLWYVIII